MMSKNENTKKDLGTIVIERVPNGWVIREMPWHPANITTTIAVAETPATLTAWVYEWAASQEKPVPEMAAALPAALNRADPWLERREAEE
jgi:predicted aldo/keto reductase-like oxidoreductase